MLSSSSTSSPTTVTSIANRASSTSRTPIVPTQARLFLATKQQLSHFRLLKETAFWPSTPKLDSPSQSLALAHARQAVEKQLSKESRPFKSANEARGRSYSLQVSSPRNPLRPSRIPRTAIPSSLLDSPVPKRAEIEPKVSEWTRKVTAEMMNEDAIDRDREVAREAWKGEMGPDLSPAYSNNGGGNGNRKRALDAAEQARRMDDSDSRYRHSLGQDSAGRGPPLHSPQYKAVGLEDGRGQRLPPPPGNYGSSSRNGYSVNGSGQRSPRNQLPSFGNLASGVPEGVRDDSEVDAKRRRLAEDIEVEMEERERWERERERERERHLQGSSGLGGERALTPPGHYSNSVPTPSGRASPRQHRRPDLPPQGRGYPEERDRDVELAPQHHKPNGGRAPSPDDRDRDRAYSQRSPGVGPRSVPSLASNFGRPSVLAGGPEGNGYDHGGGDRGGPGPMADRGGQVPGGLARRRGDAAQAKASRLHIDTGSGSSASFDGPPQGTLMVPSRSMGGIAKSAPAHKLTFGSESREIPSSQFELGRREDPVMRQGGGGPSQPSHQPGNFQSSSNHPNHPAATGSHRAHAGSGRVGEQVGHYTRREDGSREFTSPSQGGPIRNHPSAEMPHTANPISRHQQAYAQQQQQPPMSSRSYVPQTATLPSPAYHTTQFMRTGAPPMPADRERPGSIHGGERTLPPRTAGLNPPPTARLPDHLRSPPSSKTQFLALFSNFYDSLADSRTLKATLEDQIKRSNTLLQTLQRSSRVLEETVDRRLREERIIWEGRVRGLEGRVRELEAKLGGGGGGGAGGGGANVDGAADEGNESRSRESSGGETGSRRRGSGDSDALSKAESSFGKDRAGSTEETKRKVVEKSKETGSRREEQDRDAREEMEQDEEEDVKSSDH